MNDLRFLVLGALLLLFLVLAGQCRTDHPSSASDYLNLEPGVAYVGMETCRSCHPNVYQSFIQTGMGRSFGPGNRQKSAATTEAHALVYDEQKDFYYHPFFRDSQLYILEFRLENGDTVHRRLERVDYIVGSGQHTNSHIVDFGGYIYQAPITFYTQDGRWDLAPGFQDGGNLRFSRLLDSECITCHNHFPAPAPGSMNKFDAMPMGIECERCHGPGEVHVREKLAGHIVDTARHVDYTIVTPSDLSRELQMDLCQRCHLQGVAVLEEGKTFYDFKPGMRLQDVMNVFLPRFTNSHRQFIMASQADRLRKSACYERSDMTCLTCHNPHRSVEVTSREQYNSACENCHREISCSASAASLAAEQYDCVGCHMPRSGSTDIPHVRITDHYISRENLRGQTPDDAASEPAFLGLQLLTKERATDLEMARGYLALYDKYLQLPAMLDSANYYLQRSAAPAREKFNPLIHFLFSREDLARIRELSTPVVADSLQDAWTAYRIGEAWMQAGAYQQAETFYQRATGLMPLHLDFQEKRATVLAAQQRYEEAGEVYEWVLRENPKRSISLSNLGYLRALQGRWNEAEQWYDRALALDPDYVQALLNKAAVRLVQKDPATARRLLERVLRLEPQNLQARQALQQLQG